MLWHSLFKGHPPRQCGATADRKKKRFLIVPRPKTVEKAKTDEAIKKRKSTSTCLRNVQYAVIAFSYELKAQNGMFHDRPECFSGDIVNVLRNAVFQLS
ncbi:hypothetical protein AVEN_268496-1 [Araneus ventricosus]|uniref:Uncharacterized protein n=1 Tax=Araneus ventricosus TaxID=182803 RepID=A0A4Y2JDC6_ARAVE|nr:hypothetical protein AVEN_268496-1 [Araneus ventricosus]